MVKAANNTSHGGHSSPLMYWKAVVKNMLEAAPEPTPEEPRGWLVRAITELGADWRFWPRRFSKTLEEDEADLPQDLSHWEVEAVYTSTSTSSLLEALHTMAELIKRCDYTQARSKALEVLARYPREEA